MSLSLRDPSDSLKIAFVIALKYGTHPGLSKLTLCMYSPMQRSIFESKQQDMREEEGEMM